MATEEGQEFGDPRDKEQSEVDIQFTTSTNHQTIYVNGVYGGMSPRGDLHFDLVADHTERPATQSFKVNEDGSLGRQIDEEGGKNIVREKQVSIFMEPSNAFSVACWILAKLLPPEVEQRHVREVIAENFGVEEPGGEE